MPEYQYKPAVEFGGEWRYKIAKGKRNGVLQRYVSIYVEPYGTVDEFCERLQVEAEGLEGAKVELDVEYGTYGDRDHDRFYITGWREPTQEEISTKTEERRLEVERRRQYEERQIEHLRQSHPELFKERS